jgi:hypothetical protein
MSRLHLPEVGLILFNGTGDKDGAALLAFLTSKIRFADVLHLSPVKPCSGHAGDWVAIPNMDYDEAMRFQTSILGWFCRTSFQMSIEMDGFPVHPENWSDEFLQFDYIGAPWPPEVVPDQGSRVGNGGCSMRSRRFIEGLRVAPAHPQNCPGDVYWCHDPEVRKACGNYAPIETAIRFSFELPIPEMVWDHSQSFAFHKTLPNFKNLYT